jgi:hypothetical protein
MAAGMSNRLPRAGAFPIHQFDCAGVWKLTSNRNNAGLSELTLYRLRHGNAGILKKNEEMTI